MTKISYIRGLERDSFDTSKLPPKRFLNPALFSEGEFELLLVLDELELYKSFYGDPAIDKAIGMVNDSLSKGLHTGTGVGFFSSVPKGFNWVAESILYAKRRIGTASNKYSSDRLQARVRGGFDPNSPIVETRDCSSFLRDLNNPSVPESVKPSIREQYAKCVQFNEMIESINDKLAESAHHLVYAYTGQDEYTTSVSIKRDRHIVANARVAKTVGIGSNVMLRWMENGIRRTNVIQGGDPIGGSETVQGLLQKATEEGRINGIRGISGLPVAVILAIVKAVIAAIPAILAMVRKFPRNEAETILNQLPMGTAEFGAQWEYDFGGLKEVDNGDNGEGGNEGDGDSNSSTMASLILFATGAYFYNKS